MEKRIGLESLVERMCSSKTKSSAASGYSVGPIVTTTCIVADPTMLSYSTFAAARKGPLGRGEGEGGRDFRDFRHFHSRK